MGGRSLLRYAVDIVLYRALYVGDLPGRDRERSVALSGGVELTYRLNRGDIQTIREVWVEECYRPPVEVPLDCVVDLGANIATTSLWYASAAQATRFVCVEPDAENARLARRNLERNHVRAEVLEAAVGASDGSTAFRADRSANLGRAGDGDERVAMLSMRTVLARIPEGVRVDLVKMDIEGGEEAVLGGDLGWLDRVQSLIVEFHPELVEHEKLIGLVTARGFRYIPAGAARPSSMDFFTREGL